MEEAAEIVANQKELTPEQRDIALIYMAENSIQALAEHCQTVGNSKLPYEEAARLKRESLQVRPGEEKKYRDSLVWHMLPTLYHVLQPYSGLGVDDTQIFDEGMAIVQETIDKWLPVDNPQQQDYLGFKIRTAGKGRLPALITDAYGLKVNQLPLVESYFASRKLFREAYGREAVGKDGRELRKIAEAEKMPVVNEERKEDDPWLGDHFRKVHDIYSSGRVGENMADRSETADIEKSRYQEMMKEEINNLLGSLSQREREVLDLRYGLSSGEKMTLEEISSQYGLTRERIRSIEAKALKKLRHPTRSRKVRDFLA